jgi:hypothetical protein
MADNVGPLRQVGGGCCRGDRLPHQPGQLPAQASDGHPTILGLITPFVGFGQDLGRSMGDDHGRGNFIAMLATGSTAAREVKVALSQQRRFLQCARMGGQKNPVH